MSVSPSYTEGNWEYAPSTRRFRVAEGRVIVVPSNAFVTLTWHPRREVSVSPKARSSMLVNHGISNASRRCGI